MNNASRIIRAATGGGRETGAPPQKGLGSTFRLRFWALKGSRVVVVDPKGMVGPTQGGYINNYITSVTRAQALARYREGSVRKG